MHSSSVFFIFIDVVNRLMEYQDGVNCQPLANSTPRLYFSVSIQFTESHYKDTLVFGGLVQPQSVSAFEFFSTEITLEAGMVENVSALDMSGDVRFAHGRFPTDRAVPGLVCSIHHGVDLGVK